MLRTSSSEEMVNEYLAIVGKELIIGTIPFEESTYADQPCFSPAIALFTQATVGYIRITDVQRGDLLMLAFPFRHPECAVDIDFDTLRRRTTKFE
jgi:hypothetical protein